MAEHFSTFCYHFWHWFWYRPHYTTGHAKREKVSAFIFVEIISFAGPEEFWIQIYGSHSFGRPCPFRRSHAYHWMRAAIHLCSHSLSRLCAYAITLSWGEVGKQEVDECDLKEESEKKFLSLRLAQSASTDCFYCVHYNCCECAAHTRSHWRCYSLLFPFQPCMELV